jgi:hypothetical protein
MPDKILTSTIDHINKIGLEVILSCLKYAQEEANKTKLAIALPEFDWHVF